MMYSYFILLETLAEVGGRIGVHVLGATDSDKHVPQSHPGSDGS